MPAILCLEQSTISLHIFNTGDAKLAQGVYLAQSLYKDGQKNEAINLLDEISKSTPSEDDYASDWEWIKKAKELHAEY